MWSVNCILLLCGVSVFLLPNTSHASGISIRYNRLSTPRVEINCTSSDLPTASIEVENIRLKKGDADILALSKGQPGFSYGNYVRHGLSASGNIAAKGTNQISCMTVSLGLPSVNDDGDYFCVVNYIDVEGQLQSSLAKAHLDFKALVKPAGKTFEDILEDISNEVNRIQSWLAAPASDAAFDDAVKSMEEEIHQMETQLKHQPADFSDEALKEIQAQIIISEANLKKHKSELELEAKGYKDVYDEVQDKFNQLLNETDGHFDEIIQKHYVPRQKFDASVKDFENFLERRVDNDATEINLDIHAVKSDLELRQKAVEEKSRDEGLFEEKLQNSTRGFVRKDSFKTLEVRLTELDDLLEPEIEKISLLQDKVATTEAWISAFRTATQPTTTQAPGSDLAIEVLGKVKSMERRSHNWTLQVDYLLERDLETFYDISNLAGRVQSLDQTVNAFPDKGQTTKMVAFSARFEDPQLVFREQPVMFNNVTLNQGHSYNGDNSTFTAPSAGVYIFGLTLVTNTSDDFIDVDIRKNRISLSILTSQETDHTDQSTISAVARLQAGDIVRVVVKTTIPTGSYLIGHNYSVFWGYHIRD